MLGAPAPPRTEKPSRGGTARPQEAVCRGRDQSARSRRPATNPESRPPRAPPRGRSSRSEHVPLQPPLPFPPSPSRSHEVLVPQVVRVLASLCLCRPAGFFACVSRVDNVAGPGVLGPSQRALNYGRGIVAVLLSTRYPSAAAPRELAAKALGKPSKPACARSKIGALGSGTLSIDIRSLRGHLPTRRDCLLETHHVKSAYWSLSAWLDQRQQRRLTRGTLPGQNAEAPSSPPPPRARGGQRAPLGLSPGSGARARARAYESQRRRAADRLDNAATSLETFKPSEVFQGGFHDNDKAVRRARRRAQDRVAVATTRPSAKV